ncbi:MAG: alkylation repair protein [Chloroflexi bacterium]|nr:alkylation repair protein [Chloroflexota bacterium]
MMPVTTTLRSTPGSTPGRTRGTPGGPNPDAAAARSLVAGRLAGAGELGRTLADLIQDPGALVGALHIGLAALADPACLAGQRFVAPGIGPTHGVRSPLLQAIGRGFRVATRRDSPASLLLVADRLLHEREREAHWFAFGILERTLPREPERTWQVIRRAARDASDWITVDTLAHPVGKGILAEPYRWAELEQLVYAPSRWERRLVGSTIATIPFVDRTAGRGPAVAGRALPILGLLIGDGEPDVQKALAWAYRSLTIVDLPATTAALEAEAERAGREGDGQRAWVIRDALARLTPAAAGRIRQSLDGIRRRAGAPSTSIAAETAARFTDINPGLADKLPEPPLT